MLTAALTNNGKRPHPDNMDDLLTPIQFHSDNGEQHSTAPPPLSCTQFPHMKFWTKEEWRASKITRKDTSKINNTENAPGGPTTYLKLEDGTPAPRTMATSIQKTARSIWIGLFKCGKAPSKWGQASRETEDEYVHGMEKRWPILHLCEGHWKAIQIATTNYPQWYLYQSSRASQVKSKDKINNDLHKHKKAKTVVNQACGPKDEEEAGPLGGVILDTPIEDTPPPHPLTLRK